MYNKQQASFTTFIDRYDESPDVYATPAPTPGLQTPKYILRGISIVSSVILIGLGAKLEIIPGPILILLPPACSSIVWDLVTLVSSFTRNRRDISPGIRVGVDSVLLLGFAAASVLMGMVWSTWSANMPPEKEGSNLLPFVKAALVFAIAQTVLYVATLVISGYETYQRNEIKKRAR